MPRPNANVNVNVNVELLRQTLAYIETHPEEWDQTEWCCD